MGFAMLREIYYWMQGIPAKSYRKDNNMIMKDEKTLQDDMSEIDREKMIRELKRENNECLKKLEEVEKRIKELEDQLKERKLQELAASADNDLNIDLFSDAFFYKLCEDYDALAELIGALIGSKVIVKEVVPQFSISPFSYKGKKPNYFFETIVLVEVAEDCKSWKRGSQVKIKLRKSEENDQNDPFFCKGSASIFVGPSLFLNKPMPNLGIICITNFDPYGNKSLLYEAVYALKDIDMIIERPIREICLNLAALDKPDCEGPTEAIRLAHLLKERDTYDMEMFPAFSRRKKELLNPRE